MVGAMRYISESKMADVTINFSSLMSPENFDGEKCSQCQMPIYGEGFKIVLATNTDRQLLPNFKETDAILCVPCKNAAEW